MTLVGPEKKIHRGLGGATLGPIPIRSHPPTEVQQLAPEKWMVRTQAFPIP